MMKKNLLALFVIIVSAAFVHAQNTHQDSVRIKQAKKDARFFKLKKTELKRFNKEHLAATSDYFNPTIKTSKPGFLNDSVYVRAYRTAAFYNALHQSMAPSFHKILSPPGLSDWQRPVYTSGTQAIAQKDAKKFSLGTDELEKFKTRHYPNTSDYFKPTVQTASDPALLNDSLYVQTFRDEAFYKSLNQRVHPVGHSFIVLGIVFAGIIAVFATIISTADAFR